MILHAFWYPIFFFLKSVFSVTRIRFRTYGYLLSIFTFAPPNGLSPAIYAFCLGIGVGWIAVAWPSNFSSWLRQKSWSATWAVDNRVFSAFLAGYCSFNNKEKLRQPGTEPLTWGCLASLQSCALPTELSAGIEAFCLIDLFGEATLYVQVMLVLNSVPACYALVVFFWVILHAFWYPMFFFPEEWHEFELSTYGFLLSIRTFGLQNGLLPATYAFCLGTFNGWIEFLWPNSFSSWVWQKS